MKFNHTVEKAYSYSEYNNLVEQLAEKGATTGEEQTESRIQFTSLNRQRFKRLNKTVKLQPEVLSKLKTLHTPQKWYVVTESWCGDASQTLPMINKMAEASPLIDLKVVLRDKNPEVIDDFLTNGGRSIPKLIAVDENNEVLFTWGPRPVHATKMFAVFKSNPNGRTKDDFNLDLHKWYTKDKTFSAQNEIAEQL